MRLRRDRRPFRRIRAEAEAAAEGSYRRRSVIGSHARADVPNEKNLIDPNDPLSKENAALDRKIKSICRGC